MKFNIKPHRLDQPVLQYIHHDFTTTNIRNIKNMDEALKYTKEFMDMNAIEEDHIIKDDEIIIACGRFRIKQKEGIGNV